MIELIARVLKVLNSETEPAQISMAVCFAMIMGFTPLWSVHNAVVLFLVMLLRVNLSAFIMAWAVFTALAYLLDPLFHAIGLAMLQADSLKPVWTELYNNLWFRLDRFNNTITMGSLVSSLTLFIPLLLISNFGIRRYRKHLLAWIKRTRIPQVLGASKLYHAYQTISGWGGRS